MVPAVLAAGLLLRSAPPARAADDADHPRLTDDRRAHVAAHAAGIAKALGRTAGPGDLGAHRAPPKAHHKLVLTQPRGPVKLDEGGAPPVLNDLAVAPGSVESALYAEVERLFPGWTQKGRILDWVSRRAGPDDQKNLGEAYQYLCDNTSAGRASCDEVRPAVGDNDALTGRANYADTEKANAVTVMLPGIAQRNLGQQWSVTVNQAERNAPVEARALALGHELDGHAKDIQNGFLGNAGAQLPSELRAFALDAQNYLEIRAKLEAAFDYAKLDTLRSDPVWQQGDMKARIILQLPIAEASYGEAPGGSHEAGLAMEAESKGANRATASARAYIRSKYKNSGEEGLQNLDVSDDSTIGIYNRETDRMIDHIRNMSYPFMNHAF